MAQKIFRQYLFRPPRLGIFFIPAGQGTNGTSAGQTGHTLYGVCPVRPGLTAGQRGTLSRMSRLSHFKKYWWKIFRISFFRSKIYSEGGGSEYFGRPKIILGQYFLISGYSAVVNFGWTTGCWRTIFQWCISFRGVFFGRSQPRFSKIEASLSTSSAFCLGRGP